MAGMGSDRGLVETAKSMFADKGDSLLFVGAIIVQFDRPNLGPRPQLGGEVCPLPVDRQSG